jgi:hypothetical protein
MPRTNSLEDLSKLPPIHIASAQGVDRSWIARARCRPQGGAVDPRTPWTVNPNETVKVGRSTYEGPELIAMALMICMGCPAQWDCARFGITTWPNWGTWACDIEDLRFMHRQGANIARRHIDYAEARSVPVQVMSRHWRKTHLAEQREGRRVARGTVAV